MCASPDVGLDYIPQGYYHLWILILVNCRILNLKKKMVVCDIILGER